MRFQRVRPLSFHEKLSNSTFPNTREGGPAPQLRTTNYDLRTAHPPTRPPTITIRHLQSRCGVSKNLDGVREMVDKGRPSHVDLYPFRPLRHGFGWASLPRGSMADQKKASSMRTSELILSRPQRPQCHTTTVLLDDKTVSSDTSRALARQARMAEMKD